MKKYFLFPALLLMIGVAFVACEKTNDVKRWECAVRDNVLITLDMYESENKYYTTVSDTTSGLSIFFGDKVWEYYQMDGDTMIITKIEGNVGEEPLQDGWHPRWLISKPSDDVMIMSWIGSLPALPHIIGSYEFHLK